MGGENPERRSPDAIQWGSDTWIMRTLVTLSPSSGRWGQTLAGESTWSMQGVPVSVQPQISSRVQGTLTAPPLLCAFRSSYVGALLGPCSLPQGTQQPCPVSHPYLAESGLESQRGGRLRALHAGRGGGEGPGAVHPMAPCPGHWTPRLGCALHVCPRESFCTKGRKENPCVHT